MLKEQSENSSNLALDIGSLIYALEIDIIGSVVQQIEYRLRWAQNFKNITGEEPSKEALSCLEYSIPAFFKFKVEGKTVEAKWILTYNRDNKPGFNFEQFSRSEEVAQEDIDAWVTANHEKAFKLIGSEIDRLISEIPYSALAGVGIDLSGIEK